MHYAKSQLCQRPEQGISCMGCCGYNFKDKFTLAKDIEKNTLEYGKVHEQSLMKGLVAKTDWMNRSKDLRPSGVCRNLVYDLASDVVGCPLHPEQNNGKDLRVDHPHCDTLFVCKTAFMFDLWDKKRQKAFLRFLKHKKLDWHTYSLGMGTDKLLAEFEGLDWEADSVHEMQKNAGTKEQVKTTTNVLE